MKYGLIFSGQGSQYPMMGYNIYNKYEYVREMYDKASLILGYDITKICFTENEYLNQTIYTQPAMLITEISIYEVLKREYNINPEILSGFSLGEYAALYTSKTFSFEDIFKIINLRAKSMHEDSLHHSGMMVAVIGLSYNQVTAACNMVTGVYVANYNTENQIIISLLKEKLDEITSILKSMGAKRIIPLNVSGAFHSPFMKNSSDKVYELLSNIDISTLQTNVLLNVDACEANIISLKEKMRDQIIKPVLFHNIIQKLISDYSLDIIIEIGPGNVLTNFFKKYDHNIKLINIEDLKDFQKLM
ncbi:MAG: ACP S-malonyltransferase [Bacilli bacterium]